jgi:hypothetical protein
LNMFKWLFKLHEFFTFSLGGGGGGKQETVQKADPWSGAQPYISDYLQRGQQVTSSPYNFYNGETVAGFSPEQELGFNLGTQRALAGSPTLNAANRNITSTLNGDYLNPNSNPYLQANVGQALNDVTGRVNSQFNNNNFGGSAHQETLTRNLGDTASQMYGQNFANERNNQMNAAGQSIGLANADYNDSAALQAIGAQRQGLAQQYLTGAANQFQGANQHQYDQLSRYGDVIRAGQGVGGTTTSTSKGGDSGSSDMGNLIGLGLTAASFFSDVRLKSNIEKVGLLPSGLGVYEYDKFGKRERGVMAQEVEQVIPEAVSTHSSGYKMVNYGLLS